MATKRTKRTKRRPGRPSVLMESGADLLLRSAQTAFAQHGFEGSSLRKIAAAAGVDPTLATHHFGSKLALWEAVVERFATYFAPFVAELGQLQSKTKLPIRERMEYALSEFVSSICDEPESGLILATVAAERGTQLDFLIDKLVRPHHDAFRPLIEEAMDAGLLQRQSIELFYFMLLQGVLMSVSYAHVLSHFSQVPEDIDQLKTAMTDAVLATFLYSNRLR